MARLNARWFNFAARGQAWTHFWQDAAVAGNIAYTLVADPATFTLAGVAVGTKVARPITAGAGAYALSGSAVGAKVARKMAAAGTTYSMSGAAVGLKAARKMVAAPGTFTLAGSAVDLTYTPGGTPPPTVRRYYRGCPMRSDAVMLSKKFYYVDEAA